MFVMAHSSLRYAFVVANFSIPELWVISFLLHLDCTFKTYKKEIQHGGFTNGAFGGGQAEPEHFAVSQILHLHGL